MPIDTHLGLLSLPNEILLVVFSHLEDPYPLFPLSTLCRRLHFLALPIYLSRSGVYEELPSGSCNISISGESAATLAALQTALFLVNPVQSLSCTFSDSISQFRDLARFQRLCSLLKSIESVTLCFNPSTFDDYTDARISTYSLDAVRVLNTVLEKSCTTLVFSNVPDESKHFRRILRRHVWNKNEAQRASTMATFTSSASLSPAALRKRSLSTIKIHSETLLSPHFRAWTVDMLNSFPLTSLSIDIETVLHTEVVDRLLSEADIPTLSHFTMLDGRIAPARMHSFLSRHPSITHLHLGHRMMVPARQERLPPHHLPQLVSLAAEASQVAYLLHALQSMSALRTVRLLGHMTRLDLVLTETCLKPVASRLAPLSLTLVLPVPHELPRVAPDPSLHFGEETALQFVSKVELLFSDDSSALPLVKLADYIAKWSSPFPSLRAVELVGYKGRYETADVVQAVRAYAPNPETLVVNGQESSLRS